MRKGWIYCDMEMPKESAFGNSDEVLVSVIDKDKKEKVKVSSTYKGRWIIRDDFRVVAWRKLPEPVKGIR